jgi:hypothetical protein
MGGALVTPTPMRSRLTVALCLVLAAASGVQAQESSTLTSEEIEHLRAEVQKMGSSIQTMSRDLGRELAFVRDRLSLVIATTFLTSPPPSSDVVGVARVPVFGPRIEAETSRQRDALNVRVKRYDASGLRQVGNDIEVGSGQLQAVLPVDQNGALYVIEWWTSEGYTYSVQLRDGASELPVATVQVRPLQNKGRFFYVAYRLEQ